MYVGSEGTIELDLDEWTLSVWNGQWRNTIPLDPALKRNFDEVQFWSEGAALGITRGVAHTKVFLTGSQADIDLQLSAGDASAVVESLPRDARSRDELISATILLEQVGETEVRVR